MTDQERHNFQKFYDNSLASVLSEIESKRKLFIFPALLLRIMLFAFFFCIVSVFTGVILRMNLHAKGTQDTFELVFSVFGTLIILAIIGVGSNYLVKRLRLSKPERFSSKASAIIAVVALSLSLLALSVWLSLKVSENIHSAADIHFGSVFKFFCLFLFVYCPVLGLLVWIEKKYSIRYKTEVIAKIAGYLSPANVFDPKGSIPKVDFTSSKLLHVTEYSTRVRVNSMDLFSGTLKSTRYEFARLDISQDSMRTSSSATTTSSSRQVFKGLFLKAEGTVYFGGETVIRPNSAVQRMAGRFSAALKSFIHDESTLVQTGDQEFDEAFLVYSTSPNSILTLLTTEHRKLLLKLNELWEMNVSTSYIDKTGCLAISKAEDDFYPPIFSSVLRYEPVEKQFELLSSVFDFVRMLN
jgi:hypothetical protein